MPNITTGINNPPKPLQFANPTPFIPANMNPTASPPSFDAAGLLSTGLGSPGSSGDIITQIVAMVVMMMLQMCQCMMGGSAGSGTPTLITDPAPPTTTNGNGAAGSPVLKGSDFKGTVRIAQIDNFGDSHGTDIANTLKTGGADAGLGGKVDVLQFNVGNSSQKINDSLNNIITRIKNGEKIDAVNISLQAFQADGTTSATKGLVDQIIALGVPVAVAAGNNGPNANNLLEGTNSFNVQSATNGTVNSNSGRGNITVNGNTTSFATANLTPILAMLHAQGLNMAKIRTALTQIGFK